jgi:hypothetical protein
MESDIYSIRRENLKAWVARHGVPPKERSYFSQLMLGTTSIGERAARRIEVSYKMGVGYLDNPAIPDLSGRKLPELPGGSTLVRVDAAELYLLGLFRECDERGQESMLDAGEVSEKRSLTGIRYNKT